MASRAGGRAGLTAALMSLGIMTLKRNPTSLHAKVKTFRHPETAVEVTVAPIPNIAIPSYYNEVWHNNHLKYDKVYFEDGCTPFNRSSLDGIVRNVASTVIGVFPFGPIAPSEHLSKYEGEKDRDVVESRMAYHAAVTKMSPPVDPRARRLTERIAEAPPSTRIIVPWNPYHAVYLHYRLPQMGFEPSNEVELTVMGQKDFVIIFIAAVALIGFLGYSVLKWAVHAITGTRS